MESGAFSALPNLIVFNMWFNNITRIKTSAFMGSNALRELKLCSNTLKIIDSRAFTWPSSGTQFRRWSNNIESLENDSFYCPTNLTGFPGIINQYLKLN